MTSGYPATGWDARAPGQTEYWQSKGYPSKANRAWLRAPGIAATIPERDDEIAHRRKKPGRPIDFGVAQKERYKGRNVVERCFNKLKQWGVASPCGPTNSPATTEPRSASPPP